MADLKTKPTRLPLGRNGGRLSFERRLRLWLLMLALPAVLLAGVLGYLLTRSVALTAIAAAMVLVPLLVLSSYLFEQVVRPLQTLANVVAALRLDDFSFRARGGRRGDALGDLSLEVNALARTLQAQRTSALDALTLVERVLLNMQSPVLAFDEAGVLRLSNAAARASFALENSSGATAEELHLGSLLGVEDQGRYPPPEAGDGAIGPRGSVTRWSVRRAGFRLHGLPHTLFVLTDLGAALREEERRAWQSLIRVLGHEINNSLTPIKSIAGSLGGRLRRDAGDGELQADTARGLQVIEERAASLNRFLQAYQKLSRLPAPALKETDLQPLLERVRSLERRVPVELAPGPPVRLLLDGDQVEQALINLLQNAADAALSMGEGAPHVRLRWTADRFQVRIQVLDNGPGITNSANLFVPFYTTKLTGSGIGLVLAQQIAHAHGGSVALRNAEERGCVAEVILPVR